MRPATCVVGTPGMDQSTPVECLTPSLTLAHVPMNKPYITVLEALTDDAFEGDGRSLVYIPVLDLTNITVHIQAHFHSLPALYAPWLDHLGLVSVAPCLSLSFLACSTHRHYQRHTQVTLG